MTKQPEVDLINEPPHYMFGAYQSRDVMKELANVHAETFNGAVALDISTAFKYMVRCGRKGDPVEDLNKAVNYLNDAIAEIKREKFLKDTAKDLARAAANV